MNAPKNASAFHVQPSQGRHRQLVSNQPKAITPPQPARWKMTLVLWMMVYPMITGLGFALNPFLKDRPMLVRNFVLTAIFVPVMVYGAVPTARKLAIAMSGARRRGIT